MSSLPPLRLKKNEDRRLRAGHLWVFSNEVDVAQTPLTAFEPGDLVEVRDAGGRPLGSAYVNPRSLICARLYARRPGRALDEALLEQRLERALRLRERLFDEPYYRLVFGESDALPGLIADRFGDVLVLQITTAGMERATDAVIRVLERLLRPRGILLRNDTPSRELEGLAQGIAVATGEVPDEVEIRENGARFIVPVREGQKTGWFYDHRMSRARLQHYARGRRVLDVFSYVGGWGVQAAVAGAAQVVCVDASAPALEQVGRNAELNGVEDRIQAYHADAWEALKALRDAGERFDVVVLDPPAFIKRRKDAKQGEQAYRRINQLAMQLLEPDGVLVSASCSYHFPREALQDSLLRASRALDRDLQILEEGSQGPDHPVHPAIPESRYLKTFFAAVAAQ
jgi:23S rRNA (cytosine1962-C5)-methyltransferase